MPESHDVVLLYGPPWRGAARFSKHHLARYLAARGHRVLYVEAPLGPLTLARQGLAALAELREALRPPRLVAPRLWTRRYVNPVPYHAVTGVTSHRAANVLGQRLLGPRIRRDARRLGLRRPILVAGLPHAVDVLPCLSRRLLVYHCADEYAHVRGFPSTLPRLEAELCRRADVVIATAETLARSRAEHNPRTHWIPNGVEVEHFSAPATPADDVPNDGRPVVGFVGGLAQWVDMGLLRSLARARPAYHLVLVGPPGADLSPLLGLANVHLLGPRPYADVPRYLAAMDVALIPFTRDQVTWNADPIKVYEYLAAGLPVVATDLPALRRLEHVVAVAESAEAFISRVDDAVARGRQAGRAERMAEATRHSWASRFARFEALVEEQLNRCES